MKLRSWKPFRRQGKRVQDMVGSNLPILANKPVESQEPQTPKKLCPERITFSKYAYAKLQHMCHKGNSEISGFGVSDPNNPFRIIDFKLIKQKSTLAYTDMDTNAVRDYMEDELMAGRPIRVWIHTHPGDSATPSHTDEDQLSTYFRGPNYFVMFILAKGGATTCRLRMQPPELNFHVDKELPLGVERLFEPDRVIDVASWEKEYEDTVTIPAPTVVEHNYTGSGRGNYYGAGYSVCSISEEEAKALAEKLIAAWEDKEDEHGNTYLLLWKNQYDALNFTEQHLVDESIQLLKTHPNGRPVYRWATSTGLALIPD